MDFEFNDKEKKLQEQVRQFARKKLLPIWREVDDRDGFSWDVARLMAKEGLFYHVAPKEYGGVGISSVNSCIIREELGQALLQADDNFLMSFVQGLQISEFGSEYQKKKYLPALATGDMIGSGALTEPHAGSDLKAVATTATLKGDYYFLNGEKSFISNADPSEVCGVIAKTDPAGGDKGFSFFIVDVKNRKPGLECELLKICGPHPCYKLAFNNYSIPKENLLGQLGEGLAMALTTLARGRCTVGALAVGIAQAAYEEALEYAMARVAFGRPLVKFQATQLKLADMATEIDAGRLLTYRGAITADKEGKTHKAIKQSSMAKLYCTEMAQHVVDEALQIHGASGLVRGSRIEYLYRAVRAPRIYEGTNEIQRLTITRNILAELEKRGGKEINEQ